MACILSSQMQPLASDRKATLRPMHVVVDGQSTPAIVEMSSAALSSCDDSSSSLLRPSVAAALHDPGVAEHESFSADSAVVSVAALAGKSDPVSDDHCCASCRQGACLSN